MTFDVLNQPNFWDFRDANTKEGTHVIHSYPAMMIPQVARHLIARFRQEMPEAHTLLDPFCGAGTVLVEAARQGLTAYGNDLNPLALRIASARTTPISEPLLAHYMDQLEHHLTEPALNAWDGLIPEFRGRDFWFKPNVSRALTFVRDTMREHLTHPDALRLGNMAFSETVRMASNTRNSEFKLYRIAPDKLASFSPNVLRLFLRTFRRYAAGVVEFDHDLRQAPMAPRIVHGDARHLAEVPDANFDLMVTSPPYGDSRTTVAYGQFSRLSLEWLGLPPDQARTVDRLLLGGMVPKSTPDRLLPSPSLQEKLQIIASKDPSRSQEVLAFYQDLDLAIGAISNKLRPGALCAWVVANRTVKQVALPTNTIIAELSNARGYQLVEDLTRNIPNKKMPLVNSPTNVVGDKAPTMTREHLVILRYLGASR